MVIFHDCETNTEAYLSIWTDFTAPGRNIQSRMARTICTCLFEGLSRATPLFAPFANIDHQLRTCFAGQLL